MLDGNLIIHRKKSINVLTVCMLLMLAAITVSCGSTLGTAANQTEKSIYEVLTGTINYPNNLYFPSKIRIEIILLELNPYSQEKEELVTQTIRNPQRFPVNFTLRYDAKDINVINSYQIAVKVFQNDSNTHYLQNAKDYPVLGKPGTQPLIINLVGNPLAK